MNKTAYCFPLYFSDSYAARNSTSFCSLAWVYVLDEYISQKTSLTVTADLPVFMKLLQEDVVLPEKITNLTGKARKNAKRCHSDEDVQTVMVVNVNPSIPTNDNYIGEACEKLGITSQVISGETEIQALEITEMAVAELELKRVKEKKTYADLLLGLEG